MRRVRKGIAVPEVIALILVILTFAGLFGGVYYYQQEQKKLAEKGVVIHIIARQWRYIPDEIVVKKGQKVTLIITSQDVTHGFMIEAFGINKVVHPGEPVVVTFTPNKVGTFEFRCSIYCGEPWPGSGMGHWLMRGTLKVIP